MSDSGPSLTNGRRPLIEVLQTRAAREDEITGGSPYGAATLACNGELQPSANELDGARFQGRHVAAIAAKLST